MPILTVGQIVTFQASLKVIKAFVYLGDVYYIVLLLKKNTPLKYMEQIAWGVLSNDGEHISVPPEAMVKAQEIIQTIDFSNLE